MIDLDFSNVPDDPTKIQDGGGDRAKPGRGMVIITGWEEYGLYSGQAHKLELEIVAWSVPSEVGKVHQEGIFHADRSGKGHPAKRMTCLAMAAGLFTAADVVQWKQQGTAPQIDFSNLVSRPIMIELVEEPRQNEPTKLDIKIGNIGLAFYHIHDPRVKGWPVNQTVINQRASKVGQWATGTTTTTQPIQQKPATPPVNVQSAGDIW